jgi:hypothetical protein
LLKAIEAADARFRPGEYEVEITRSAHVNGHWQRISERGKTVHVWHDYVIRRASTDDAWLLFRGDRVIAKDIFINRLKETAVDVTKGDAP